MLSFLLSYLYFYHWSFEIIFLSPILVYPFIALNAGLRFKIIPRNHTILLYLFYVLGVSIYRQLELGIFVRQEFIIMAIQLFSYFIGYRVVQRFSSCKIKSVINFSYLLNIISIFIILTAITNVFEGRAYSHGFNIFGYSFLFSPEWPIFSMLCVGAFCVLQRSQLRKLLYFSFVFLAANSRSVILMYFYVVLKFSSGYRRFLIFAFVFPGVFFIVINNSYLIERFLEIADQLNVNDMATYVEKMSSFGLVNDNLYREENLSGSLRHCTRIGDLGRIGNTLYGVYNALPYMYLGTGFSLANFYLLCMDSGFYHPAGPAWNPFIFGFIQGGFVGGSFLLVCTYKILSGIRTRDTFFYLILILFISSMITKGLSSYVFWTLLGILSSLKGQDD